MKPLRIGQNSILERGHLEALRALEEYIQAGGKPEAFSGRLQTSPEMALVPAPGQPLPPLLEEHEEDQEAPEELVAAAVSHLDGLLSFLMKAARNSWELPTSQVQLLVGAKPRGGHLRQARVQLPAHRAAWPGDQLGGGAVNSDQVFVGQYEDSDLNIGGNNWHRGLLKAKPHNQPRLIL